MPEMTLGSRDVERFLTAFHDIASDQQSAYAGRLKHISRQGFPVGVGAGRGTPARYDAEQFFQMLAVTELTQFGVPPTRAINLVTEAWPRLRKTVLHVWSAIEAAERGVAVTVPPIFWSVPLMAQRYRAHTDQPDSPDESGALRVMTANELQEALEKSGYNIRRLAFIAAHQVIADAFRHLRYGYEAWPPERVAAFMQSMVSAPSV